MERTDGPLLAGPENPGGWGLAELLGRLAGEVGARGAGAGTLAARRAAANDARIAALLERARAIQADTEAAGGPA